MPFTADPGAFVPLAQGTENRLELRGGEAHAGFPIQVAQVGEKGGSILVQFFAMAARELGKKFPDLFLTRFPGLDLFQAGSIVLLFAGGDVDKSTFRFQTGDALRRCLEVQAKGALHRDLVKAEVGVVEDLADHALALDGLSGDGVLLGEEARFPVLEVSEQPGDVRDLVRFTSPVGGVADLVALIAQTLGHLHEETAGVDELHLALAPWLLAVGEQPDIG